MLYALFALAGLSLFLAGVITGFLIAIWYDK